MIIIMAIVQDIPFRDYQDVQFKVLWLDEDQKSASDSLINYLSATKQFELVNQIRGKDLNLRMLQQEVEKGNYPVGIFVPKGFNAAILNKTNHLVELISKKYGQLSVYPVRKDLDNIKLLVAFDPAAKNTYRISVQNVIDKLILKLQYDNLISKLSPTNDQRLENELPILDPMVSQLNPSPNSNPTIISSVQHNVPAWIVFAIFFLILPLAGNQIKENEAGSRIRLAMTPGSNVDLQLGKILFYMLVAVIQFLFLLVMSRLLLPLFGLPPLIIGNHWLLLIIDALIISFPAIILGILIGNIFTTYHQAMMFGSILIILLSAVGGIWIPVAVLPHWLQLAAEVSPLHWSLELINDTMLRGFSWNAFLTKSSILICFGILFLVVIKIILSRKMIKY